MFFPPKCPFCNSDNVIQDKLNFILCKKSDLYISLHFDGKIFHEYQIILTELNLIERLAFRKNEVFITIKNEFDFKTNKANSRIIKSDNCKYLKKEFDNYINISEYEKYLMLV